MSILPKSVTELIEAFAAMPGVGKKSAKRMAFYLLKANREEAVNMAKAIINVKDRIYDCSECHNIAEKDPCSICTDPKRDRSILCVVEDPMDLLALESTANYRGLYHVLGGVISPLNGVGPDNLNIEDLLHRAEKDVQEVILALNSTRDGETTEIFLSKMLRSKGVKVTRLAHGLPVGTNLEFADETTLIRAMEGRTNIL
ncbi:MAG: recombination mediator RecR [Fidelibacterota bacterium]